MSKTRLQQKWEQARDDLGLDIVIPFRLELGNPAIYAEVLVKNFGGQNGMLVVNSYRIIKDNLEGLQKLGFGFSVQDEPRGNANDLYDRIAMIEMLNDWGWSGPPAETPDWITAAE